MGKVIDLTGMRFGRLTVIERAGKNKYGSVLWLCQCDCGKQKVINGCNLRGGFTQSCGCLALDVLKERVTIHGHSCVGKVSKTFRAWDDMIHRCTREKHPEYKRYGARGIKVCDRWLQKKGVGFSNFLHDMGESPSGLTLDRIDNDGNYEPSNCRWTTQKKQHRNMRTNRLITIDNETKCMAEWCERYNLRQDTVSGRIERGWTIEEAFGIVKREK